ncbi:MAG: hypothetical protein A2X61_05930 [Ignavibacteria bacterium GWB2_35_12]|nr:MAG: hypothetical protein A2X61_05930 [Ignavibacteria bacterium GWB2_35_12]OGU86415.1 MAG: hypothetical protein A2220_04015 [Ignavibacteria bacterium RIFOXYA2_FULL_35_10]OGV22135.1 MAG: hypothetical protein A2475_05490 [Ignavibacteria bacterium RIFOXYC2_FULL_35_21]
MQDNNSEIIIYKNPEGNIKIDVTLNEETVWLTQEQMATLFGKARTTITEHIQNVFKEGELDEKVVCRNFRQTTQHGAIKGKTIMKNEIDNNDGYNELIKTIAVNRKRQLL